MPDPNTTICGGFQKEIQLFDCWNSTFAYYSIDMCTAGAPTSDTLPSPTSPPTATFSSSSSNSGPPTAALAGGIVGGLVGLALLVALAWWILRRKKRAWQQQAIEQHVAAVEVAATPWRSEVDGGISRHEMEEGKGVYKHRAAEVEHPPAELAGNEGAQPRDGGYTVRGDV